MRKITDISEIDWNGYLLERQRENAAKKQNRGSKFWDGRAPSFARHAGTTGYAGRFIDILKPDKTWTVLDMGCGAGTIAIPLSEKVKEITAVDFSDIMLNILREDSRALGVSNIETIKASWEDDWEKAGIGVYDAAIASRSLAVDDMHAAIKKLDSAARKRVCISTVVGDGPHDRRIFEAVGREFRTFPDYIYIYNLIYQMGIRANINFTREEPVKIYSDHDDAVNSLRWMFQEMTREEESRLRAYLQEHLVPQKDKWAFNYKRSHQWAVIWWDKED